ncbi:hypothetical protein JCM19301_1758 [Jejuia pallidilutea]|uniref:Uncharacterized protein n=1 Tax=Jejuia pallidilutea TaxID=504487 RepID=A0A090VVS0_9FLAO|nr:hypothetical protein JCM19301_1758 [Jejuia pallidilutea]GAL71887.1 hypothetical protein JCM19302_1327 [Jejuia pallidilutea]GAL90220.1 hypothetical protein JCM19538_687 [Jejuia pallidilutea]
MLKVVNALMVCNFYVLFFIEHSKDALQSKRIIIHLTEL